MKCSVLVRWSRCSRIPSITDILVNTSDTVYVERGGVLEETNVVFKDNHHLMHIIEKIVSKVGRRVDESAPMVDARSARRLARECHHPAAGDRWAYSVDSPLRNRSAEGPGSAVLSRAHAGHDGGAGESRAGAAEHHRLRGNGRRQDDTAQRAVGLHFAARAHCDHRRLGRAAAEAEARRAAGMPSAERRGQGRRAPARAAGQRAAHAPGPHHRRRGAGRGSAGHAAGDEHRSRRLDHHGPCQHARATRWHESKPWR